MKSIKASARVKILLEISLSDRWGSDCTLTQVHKQAKDSARNRLNGILAGVADVQIIGKPEAMAILVEELE